jgi:hypothetical protein
LSHREHRDIRPTPKILCELGGKRSSGREKANGQSSGGPEKKALEGPEASGTEKTDRARQRKTSNPTVNNQAEWRTLAQRHNLDDLHQQ